MKGNMMAIMMLGLANQFAQEDGYTDFMEMAEEAEKALGPIEVPQEEEKKEDK